MPYLNKQVLSSKTFEQELLQSISIMDQNNKPFGQENNHKGRGKMRAQSPRSKVRFFPFVDNESTWNPLHDCLSCSVPPSLLILTIAHHQNPSISKTANGTFKKDKLQDCQWKSMRTFSCSCNGIEV